MKNLVEECRPAMLYDRLAEIDFAGLAKDQGIHYYIVDLDNTLAWRGSLEADSEAAAAIRPAQRAGNILGLCLLSNLGLPWPWRRRRVCDIARSLGADAYVCAYWPRTKPLPYPFRRALGLLGNRPEATAVIGDQLLTDVRGGNRLGLTTIYVSPFGPHHWLTELARGRREQALLRHYLREYAHRFLDDDCLPSPAP